MQNDETPKTEAPVNEMLKFMGNTAGETSQPRIPVPDVQGERRKQDRRQSDRQGKYDRRKNRCANCAHFQENGADPENGFCQYHSIIVVASAFACPYFDSLPSDSANK